MNVGATAPEEAGRYFSWGNPMNRPVAHASFSSSSNFQYIGDDIAGIEEYDVATSWWGSDWQMPSADQCRELINSNNTTREWTEVNGVKGMRFTSKTNGKSIFMPVTDYADEWGFHSRNFGDTYKNRGYYWTSTFNKRSTNETDSRYKNAWAYLLEIMPTPYVADWDNINRSNGLTIRPVRSSNN